MKKAFTMIELIFVIVILGILAAVAVPKLTATRDDAEIAKAVTNANQVLSDITNYYTSKGDFAKSGGNIKIQDMTNVPLNGSTAGSAVDNGTATNGTGYLYVKGQKCLTFAVGTATTASNPGNGLSVGDKYVSVTPENGSANAICTSMYNTKAMDGLITKTTPASGTTTYAVKYHKIGGSEISNII